MRKSKKQELEIMQSIADSFKESQKSNEEVSNNIKTAIETINQVWKNEQVENRQFLLELSNNSNTNTELILNSVNAILPTTENEDVPEESEEEKEKKEEEKKKKALLAAYALNLCTVSVSQIIDYNDIVVLEQEYEAILNNLNLENIPKDEALLNTLKQILDVITFFRIQEGDKKFIEKEYKAKMKNAIWSSVPNLSVVLASGDPYAMVGALITQVGIGYMNYRKHKSEYSLQKEKQEWQLQRSAIEQFNGLRRELFDASWRLSDSYNFKDEYRLTERQIKQYNEILLDYDEYRKYERLRLIEDKFQAYPNYYYFLANAAQSVALDAEKYDNLTDEDICKLCSEAKSYYEHYYQFVKNNNILREDQIASACALEYISLLDINEDKNKIHELLNFAIEKSGNALDVIQLCAITYFRIKEFKDAEKLFRKLVNEGYNTLTNAQILSAIYVALSQQGLDVHKDYYLLTKRVSEKYLYELPEKILNEEESKNFQIEFNNRRIDAVEEKFDNLVKDLRKKHCIEFNKCVPAPNFHDNEDDYYCDVSPKRRKDLDNVLNDGDLIKKYKNKLYKSNFVYYWACEINNVCNSLLCFEPITNYGEKEFKGEIDNKVEESQESLGKYENIQNEGTSKEDINALLSLNLESFMEEIFSEVDDKVEAAFKELRKQPHINEKLNEIEKIIDDVAKAEKIIIPEIIIQDECVGSDNSDRFYVSNAFDRYIDPKLRERIDSINKMIELIKEAKDSLINDKEKIQIEISDPRKINNDEFNIATIADISKEKKKEKIVLTEKEVLFIKEGFVDGVKKMFGSDKYYHTNYSSIDKTENTNEITGETGKGKVKVKLEGVNIEEFLKLMSDLADVDKKHD